MKFNKFLFGAAALSMGVFASCSSDEPANNGGSGTVEADRYMAVKISNPSNTSRAAGPGFEEGVGSENKLTATNVRFYFFNADKQPFTLVPTNVSGAVASNMVTPMDLNSGNQDGNSAISTGILVLGKPEKPYVGDTPKYVLCAANLTEDEFKELAGKTMADVEKVTRTKMTDGGLDWTTFAMVNSTYAEGGQKVIATEIPDGSICTTVADAEQKPVNIYIERLAAKVRVKGLGIYQPQVSGDDATKVTFEFNKPDGNTETKTLWVNLTNWRLKNRYVFSKLVKDINPAANYFDKWNDPDYHRCYWGVTPADDQYLFQKEYDIKDTTDPVKGFVLGNFDETKPTENIRYTYANTAWATKPESASDRSTNVTSIMVRGEVCSDEAGTTPVDFVYWGGGYYLTEDFKAVVNAQYNVVMGTPNATNTVEFAYIGNNKYCAKVNGNNYERYTNIQWWEAGQTSYNLNVKHATDVAGDPLYGIVRNHIYENIFNGVVGLGVPGNEPENPTKDQESYIAATVQVLNWKVVSNTVVLE